MRRHLGRARAPSRWSCRSGLRPHRSNDGSLGSSGVASQILTSPLTQLRLRVFDKCFRHFAVTRGEPVSLWTVLPRVEDITDAGMRAMWEQEQAMDGEAAPEALGS